MSVSPTRLSELGETLGEALVASDGPVVLFSALWPLARATATAPPDLADFIIDEIGRRAGPRRSILAPTFTPGYADGFLDLDATPGTTGMLGEMLRARPGARRTLSAFFSYAVLGPDASEAAALRPTDAWGDGSLYAWLEARDATFIMAGTHPTHCSYLHRMEWLARDVLVYRFRKAIAGRVRHEGRDFDFAETLFVRTADPAPINDFTTILPALLDGGMRIHKIGGVQIASMSASMMKDAFLPALLADPTIVVKNAEDFKAHDQR